MGASGKKIYQRLVEQKLDTSGLTESQRQALDASLPPAWDPKSSGHLKALSKSLTAAQKEAHDAADYVGDLIDNLEQSLSNYRQAEDRNEQGLRRTRT